MMTCNMEIKDAVHYLLTMFSTALQTNKNPMIYGNPLKLRGKSQLIDKNIETYFFQRD